MRIFHFLFYSVLIVAGASAVKTASAQEAGAQARADDTFLVASAAAAQPAEWSADAASRAIVRPLPEYPVKALMLGVHQGQTLLQYTIDNEGSVGDIEVVNGTPFFGFNHSARQAVEQWRFNPMGQQVQRRVQFVFVAVP